MHRRTRNRGYGFLKSPGALSGLAHQLVLRIADAGLDLGLDRGWFLYLTEFHWHMTQERRIKDKT
jgi:hypothetical protein